SSEPFVIAHDQLRFQLLNGIHSHADDDQERSTTKIKLHTQALEEPYREVPVKPATNAPAQMVEMDTSDHPFRKQADERKINGADKRKALQDAADVLGGGASGPNARNE